MIHDKLGASARAHASTGRTCVHARGAAPPAALTTFDAPMGSGEHVHAAVCVRAAEVSVAGLGEIARDADSVGIRNHPLNLLVG